MRRKRTDLMEQAQAIHKALQTMGRTAPDEVVLAVPTAFDQWATDTDYTAGDVRRHEKQLYRCQITHTSQATWTPAATPALWVVINVSNAGTPEDNKVYKCERGAETGTIVLQYLPHELVGNYFIEVE